uniref:Uncharacterized protein n=1 Tax=Glycine max TaxID=3847 RepID=C6TBH2_SOYBN|nr:unknown [Glycine max]
MSAMVAITDWKQLPFEFDEEKAEVRLEVVMTVEETLELFGELDVLYAVVALARNVQPWAEIDDSLQEQQMKLALKVGSGVSSEEFGFEIHLLDPVHHRAQAIMEQAEYLVFVLVVLTADCSVKPLAELLKPRSKQFSSPKFLPMDGCETDIKRKQKTIPLEVLAPFQA